MLVEFTSIRHRFDQHFSLGIAAFFTFRCFNLRLLIASFTLPSHSSITLDLLSNSCFVNARFTFYFRQGLPNNYDNKKTDIVTHALVFMLGGIASRWKQVVAYFFTSDRERVNGSLIKANNM